MRPIGLRLRHGVDALGNALATSGKLAWGATKLVAAGVYNEVVKIGGGLASIPYAVFAGADAAVAVQEATHNALSWTPSGDGVQMIGKGLSPLSQVVGDLGNSLRSTSERYLGDGATTILFGGLQAGVEIAGVVGGLRGAQALVEGGFARFGNTAVRVDEMGTFTAAGAEVFHAPGMTRIGSDAVSVRVSENVAPINGVHDVVVHGIPYDESGAVFLVDNLPTNARQVAEAVKANPSWDGQPIRLLTCYGGCGPLSPAQELSTILNAPVQGATNAVGVARVPGSVPVVRNGGSWIDFLPQ